MTVQSLVALQHAKLARTVGDEAAAEALLTQARLFFPEPDAAMRRVLAEEAVAQALRFDPCRAAPLSASSTRIDRRPRLRARLALIDGDRRRQRPCSPTDLGRSRRERVERSVLRALSVADRDVELANEHLAAALAAARPERWCAP